MKLKISDFEVSIIKAMVATGSYDDQQVLAYFTRPDRTINHRLISEIRRGTKYQAVAQANDPDLNNFLANWPLYDPETGATDEDELIIRAREAMIAAVQTFNSGGYRFRTELFVVTAIIAWTYVMHAFLARRGVDYRYIKGGEVQKTREGADKYWELGKCIKHSDCPMSKGAKKNLEFLLELRHEIEHRGTGQIDLGVSSKLQACCLNFENFICAEFGSRFSLSKRLPLALQFARFSRAQKAQLTQKPSGSLPAHIQAMASKFDADGDKIDQEFTYRVRMVEVISNHASSADVAVEFFKADSVEADEVDKVLIKEVSKRRYRATKVVEQVQQRGWPAFRLQDHTNLWRKLDAKNPNKGFGCEGDYQGTWVWFDHWITHVTNHCKEHGLPIPR